MKIYSRDKVGRRILDVAEIPSPRMIFWINLIVVGYGILALGYPVTWARLPYCLAFISAAISMIVLVGLSADQGPFGPPMVQIIASIGLIMNLVLIGIGIAVLVLVDLPSSVRTGSFIIGIGLTNFAYLARNSKAIRSAGFPESE